MHPDPESKDLTVVALHEGTTTRMVEENTGWPVRFASQLDRTPPPTTAELEVLRDLRARTAEAHGAESR